MRNRRNRRLIRRKRRTYRKKFRKALRRTYGSKKNKRIGQRMTLSGVRKRIISKSEIKFIDYNLEVGTIIDTFDTSGNWGKRIWTTDTAYADPASQRYMPMITQGPGFNQRIGDSWIYNGLDLRFLVRSVPSGSNVNPNIFRLYIVKNKIQQNISPSASNMPLTFNQPIDTRIWDVIYDRTFAMDNGFVNNGDSSYTNHVQSKIKAFRFKIPFRLKETTQATTGVANPVLFPQNIYVYIGSLDLCSDFIFTSVNCRIYFMDPQ